MFSNFSASLVAMFLAAGSVDVRSTTDCPSTAEVVERLQTLIPRDTTTSLNNHEATLDVIDTRPDGTIGMHLRVLRDDGSVIGDRDLFLRGGCREMALAVAAVIAAWETEPRSETLANPTSAMHGDTAIVSMPASALRRAPTQILVGVGVGGGFLGGTALVANAEAQVGRADSHWQLRVGMMAEQSRQVDLDSGQVDWQHAMVTAGLLWRSLVSAWVWSFDAGPTVGWATLQGNGYASNRKDRSFEYGVTSGVRIGRPLGRWTVWAEGRANLWLRGQRAWLTGSEHTVGLTPGDVSASVGTTVLLFQ